MLLLRTCGSHLDLALPCPVQAQQHPSVWPAMGTSPSPQVGSEMCSGVLLPPGEQGWPQVFGSPGAVLEQCGCGAGAAPKWCWPCQAEDQQREHKSAKIPPGSSGGEKGSGCTGVHWCALVCTGPLLCPGGGKSPLHSRAAGLPGSAGTVGPTGTAPSSSGDAAGSLGHILGQIFCPLKLQLSPPHVTAASSAKAVPGAGVVAGQLVPPGPCTEAFSIAEPICFWSPLCEKDTVVKFMGLFLMENYI